MASGWYIHVPKLELAIRVPRDQRITYSTTILSLFRLSCLSTRWYICSLVARTSEIKLELDISKSLANCCKITSTYTSNGLLLTFVRISLASTSKLSWSCKPRNSLPTRFIAMRAIINSRYSRDSVGHRCMSVMRPERVKRSAPSKKTHLPTIQVLGTSTSSPLPSDSSLLPNSRHGGPIDAHIARFHATHRNGVPTTPRSQDVLQDYLKYDRGMASPLVSMHFLLLVLSNPPSQSHPLKQMLLLSPDLYYSTTSTDNIHHPGDNWL